MIMLESTVETVLVICTTELSVFLNISVRFSRITGIGMVEGLVVEYPLFVDRVTTTMASDTIKQISITCFGFIANTSNDLPEKHTCSFSSVNSHLSASCIIDSTKYCHQYDRNADRRK